MFARIYNLGKFKSFIYFPPQKDHLALLLCLTRPIIKNSLWWAFSNDVSANSILKTKSESFIIENGKSLLFLLFVLLWQEKPRKQLWFAIVRLQMSYPLDLFLLQSTKVQHMKNICNYCKQSVLSILIQVYFKATCRTQPWVTLITQHLSKQGC